MFCFHKLRKHYKEYLIFKFNEALIDPADDMDVGELRAVIMREEKAIPEGDEKNAQYKETLKEVSRRCRCLVCGEGFCVFNVWCQVLINHLCVVCKLRIAHILCPYSLFLSFYCLLLPLPSQQLKKDFPLDHRGGLNF